MPEATSNSTVTIPGGITSNNILDAMSANELLAALTGGTVTAGDGSAINNNTYYQPVDISQNFGGRSVTSLSGGAVRLQAPELMPLQPMAAMPQMPAMQRANTVGLQDVGKYIAGIGGGMSSAANANPVPVQGPPAMPRGPQLAPPQQAQYADPRTGQAMPNIMESGEVSNQPPQQAPIVVQQRPVMQPQSRGLGPADIAAIKQQGIDEFLKKQSESPAGPLGQYFTPEALERQQSYERMLPQAVALAQGNKKPVSRFLERMAGGLNQNIAARQAAEAKGKWDIIQKAVEADSQMQRRMVEDMTTLQKAAMDNDTKLKIASLKADGKGALTQMQAHTLAQTALDKYDPRIPTERDMLLDVLEQAQAVTGFPYVKHMFSRSQTALAEAQKKKGDAASSIIGAARQAYQASNDGINQFNKERQADATYDSTLANTDKAKAQTDLSREALSLYPGKRTLQAQAIDKYNLERPGVMADAVKKQYEAFLKGNDAERVELANRKEDNALALSDNEVANIPIMNMQRQAQTISAVAKSLLDEYGLPFDLKLKKDAATKSDQAIVKGDQEIQKNRIALANADISRGEKLMRMALMAKDAGNREQAGKLAQQAMILSQSGLNRVAQLSRQNPAVSNAFDLRAATVDTQAAGRALGTNASQNYRAPESADQIMDNRLRREDDALARGGNTLRISKAPATDYEMIGDEAARKDQALAKIDEWRYSAPGEQTQRDQQAYDATIKKDKALALIDKWKGEATQLNDFQRQAAINLNQRGLKFRNIDQAKAAIKAEAKRLQAQAQKRDRNAGLSPDALAMVNGIHAAAQGRKLFNLSTDDNRPLEIYSPIGDRKTKGTNMVRFNGPLN